MHVLCLTNVFTVMSFRVNMVISILMLLPIMNRPSKSFSNNEGDGSDNVAIIKSIRVFFEPLLRLMQLAWNVECRWISMELNFLGSHLSLERERKIRRHVFTSLSLLKLSIKRRRDDGDNGERWFLDTVRSLQSSILTFRSSHYALRRLC